MSVDESRLFLDPMPAPSDAVTDARTVPPARTTYAALVEETGDEAGVLGGTILVFGGEVTHERSRQGSHVHVFEAFEGTDQWRDVRHLGLSTPEGRLSVVRAKTTEDAPLRPLVVYCPGTVSTIDTSALFSAFKIGDYAGGMLFFDYPGYGRSEGRRSVVGVEAAIEALASELSRPDSRPLVLWGYSLSGFACAELAARTAPDALILDSPVHNATEAVRFFVPDWMSFVLRPFMRFDGPLRRFDIAASLAMSDVPILVIGAERDGILPEAGAIRLHDALAADGHEVAYVQAKGEGHFGLRETDEVIEAVNGLLRAPRDLLVPTEEF